MDIAGSIANDNYIRPKETYTDRLDDDDIADKLIDYVKVDDISTVALNTHLRYFILETDKKKGTVKRVFRMGGFLSNKKSPDKYVILSNGKTTWSVQTATAVFYRKLTIDEIKEEYEADLEKSQIISKKLLKQNNIFKQFIQKLGYDYKKVIEQYSRVPTQKEADQGDDDAVKYKAKHSAGLIEKSQDVNIRSQKHNKSLANDSLSNKSNDKPKKSKDNDIFYKDI